MAKRYRKRIIFAEAEASYGSPETLVAADAIETKNLTLDSPYAGDRVTRDLNRDDLGLEASVNTNPHVVISFDCELAGSGTAGDAPAIGDLLKAAGFTEVIDPGVDVEYTPSSDPTDSVTIGLYLDGELHTIAGARGTWEINFERGYPYIRFTFMGLYATPTSASAPTPDFSAFTDPIPMTNDNTPTVTIGAYNAVLQSLTAVGNLGLVARNVPNLEEIIQPDRQVTGQIVIDRPDIASKDIYTDAVESHAGINTQAVQIVHGTTSGAIVQFDAPAVQLEDISDQDDNSIAMSSLSARYIPSSGDDEVKLTFK